MPRNPRRGGATLTPRRMPAVIAPVVLALFFLFVGGTALTALLIHDLWMFRYHVWLLHLPIWVHYVAAIGEICTGVLMLRPATRFHGAVVGIAIMTLALVTMIGDGFTWRIPVPLAALVLAGFVAARSRRKPT